MIQLLLRCLTRSMENLEMFNLAFQGVRFHKFDSRLIGHDRVLCAAHGDGKFRLYLFKLDSDAFTFSILDEQSFYFYFHQIVIDYEGSLKFVLLPASNMFSVIYKGHLANDRIHVKQQRIDFGVELWYCKLVGNISLRFDLKKDRMTGTLCSTILVQIRLAKFKIGKSLLVLLIQFADHLLLLLMSGRTTSCTFLESLGQKFCSQLSSLIPKLANGLQQSSLESDLSKR